MAFCRHRERARGVEMKASVFPHFDSVAARRFGLEPRVLFFCMYFGGHVACGRFLFLRTDIIYN